jgi:hypothetical protein
VGFVIAILAAIGAQPLLMPSHYGSQVSLLRKFQCMKMFSLCSFQESIRILDGEINLRSYTKADKTIRRWCNVCGGHLFTYHQKLRLIDVYPSTLVKYQFTPTVHLNYHKCILVAQRDGLLKKGAYGEDLPDEVVVQTTDEAVTKDTTKHISK